MDRTPLDQVRSDRRVNLDPVGEAHLTAGERRRERILRCRIHWAAGYATAGFMQNAQLSAARGFDRGLQHYKLFI